ncbi:hypothetical protein CK218_05880 [Mesorhizobium sp. WSM3879]|uniref:sulfotransferase n=1 Tax=Mesorhizobium sp. WSM3879 TaxID=2029406 RepID=UPI000BB03C55|nr:sulfotransferase [Mesorhizobium sp. WSM3879]PBB82376.1 hypothetical protein CK218_05880 [Mesorhizobium sp. WSM3879]
MNFDFVFIVTYGRSGSTLLQGILNAIPGVVIRGENAGTLHGLAQAWHAAKTAQELFSFESYKTTSPWYGATFMDVDTFGKDLAASFIRNVLRPPSSVRTTGFKEIRYNLTAEELAIDFEFIRRFFKHCSFIINTRDISATIASSQKSKHGISEEELLDADRLLRQVAESLSDDIFHVHYDDYRNDLSRLKPLFDFLGATFDENTLRNILSTKHSM